VQLDCWTHNGALRHYYSQHGFQHQHDIDDEGYLLSLYELRL